MRRYFLAKVLGDDMRFGAVLFNYDVLKRLIFNETCSLILERKLIDLYNINVKFCLQGYPPPPRPAQPSTPNAHDPDSVSN